MPQGKVIAVKPMGYASGSALMYSRSMDAGESDTSKADEEAGNLVYIEVYKKESKIRAREKIETVVWYIDTSGRLMEGDYVEFKINPNKTKPIKGAENVTKLKGGKLRLPGDLFSKVALLASLLLFFSVALDRER